MLPGTWPRLAKHTRTPPYNSRDESKQNCEISSSYGDWSECSQKCNSGTKYRYKEIKRYAGVCGASNIRYHTVIQTASCIQRHCTEAEGEMVRYRHVTIPSIRLSAAQPKDEDHTQVVGMADNAEEITSLGEPLDSHIGPGTTYTVSNAHTAM